MSFDFSTLVTDRLQSDVDERNAKGTYNAADLNRVTAAMEALDEMFRAYGYHTGYVPMPTWSEYDIPTQAQMDQYLDNLAALRSALASVPEEPPTPESMELLTYLTANRIEEILQQLDIYLAGIGQSFLRAGMGWSAAGTALYFLSRPYDSGPSPDVYDPIFENNEWAAIIEACQNNAVPDTWLADGSCSKAMTIGGTSYTIDVIGKQHDQYADGGTAPLTFQLRQIPVSLQMNASNTVSGGWGSSAMRSTELPQLKNQLPADVRNAIRMVSKQSNGAWTQDDLFLLSSPEVFGGGGDSGEQYEYYQAGNSKIKGYWYDPSITASWWLRDYAGSQFQVVDDDGTLTARSPTSYTGAVYAFCF